MGQNCRLIQPIKISGGLGAESTVVLQNGIAGATSRTELLLNELDPKTGESFIMIPYGILIRNYVSKNFLAADGNWLNINVRTGELPGRVSQK